MDDTTGCYYRLVEQWNRRAAGEMPVEVNLIHAFVRGAKWWEYKKTGATMWPSDQNDAENEAIKRYPRAGQEE